MIISLLIALIIIILGILWVNKYNIKEGLDNLSDLNKITAISDTALKDLKTKLTAAGVPDLSQNINTTINDAIDKMSALMTTEADSVSDRPYEPVTDLTGLVIDTTPEVCIDPTAANCTPAALFIGQNKSFFAGTTFSKGFCDSYSNDPVKLNQQCNRLTAENCNSTDCCIFLNGAKCVAGNMNGPLFTVEDGTDIDYSYYSHKNKCYGSCGTGQANSANPCTAYNDTDPNLSIQCLTRLWGETGCPNKNYINPSTVEQLKDYSKVAIKRQFKTANSEENYSKCYGEDMSKWPAACKGTTSSSIGIGLRCMRKLFKEAGCTSTSFINSAYVEDNQVEPVSGLIKQFKEIRAGKDLESYRKCHGPDELTWPDACAGVPHTARFKQGEVPQPCAHTMWRDVTKSKCTNAGIIDALWYGPAAAKLQDTQTLGYVRDQYKRAQSLNDSLTSNRTYCQGVNPNNWSDVTPMIPDPCASIDYSTIIKDVPATCLKRISDLIPSTLDSTSKNMLNAALTPGNKSYANSPVWTITQQFDI